jgi:hypothetical protein
MREALDDYLATGKPDRSPPMPRQSTIEFLLRRMRHKSDFPALSESVAAINRITNIGESEHVPKSRIRSSRTSR